MATGKTVIRTAVLIAVLMSLIINCIIPVMADEGENTCLITDSGIEEYDPEYNVTYDPVTELTEEDGYVYDPATGMQTMLVEEEQDPQASSFKIDNIFTYPYLQLGSSVTFKASKNAVWSSTDPKVIKISKDGTAYAAGRGTATVNAVSSDGTESKAQYTLTVTSIKDTGVKLIGHRGYCKFAPENTLASFKLAADSGVNCIECDVYKTADDVFVLSHDNNLSKMYGSDKNITECNYKDIKDLVAVSGNGSSVYMDEHIPTLDSFMKLIATGKKKAIIDVKEEYIQEYSDMLYRKISSYNINDRIYFLGSVNTLLSLENSIETYRDKYPVSPKLLLSCSRDPSETEERFEGKNAMEYAAEHGYYGICTRYYYMDSDKTAAAHDLGLKVGVWTINDYSTAYYYGSSIGIDAVISDYDLSKYVFKDVIPRHNYAKPVYWASGKRITEGYTDGSGLFGVSDKVLRGQVVTFLWRMAGKPEPVGRKQTFKDVPVSHSYYKAIQWAYEQGITAGYKNGTFGVNKPCTRGQTVMFMWRYNNCPAPVGKNVVFTDVPKKHGYYKAIKWAVENSITEGYGDGSFGVNKNCTRGHMVTFLWRMN